MKFDTKLLKSRSKKQDRLTLGSLYNQSIERQELHFDNEEDMIQAMADPYRWETWLWQTVDAYKAKYPHKDGFIQLLTVKDKFIKTRVTLKFVARYSCPDPWFEETVWYYDHKNDELERLWTLPDPETCKLYIEHQNNIVPEEQQLLQHILDCKNGKLDQLARWYNGEKKDSVHILLNSVPENLIVN